MQSESARPRKVARDVYHFLHTLVTDAVQSVKEWSVLKKAIVLIALVGFVIVTIVVDAPSVSTLRQWADQTGGGFLFLFGALYVVLTQFPVPRTVLTVTSGVLFGPWVGVFVALTATTVSAALSLLIVRGLLGEWMRPRLNHSAVDGINRRLEERGWLAVTSLRMIAAVPFSVLNYAAALTAVPVWPFILATFIGSAPGTIATVFFGDTLTGQADPIIIGVTVALALLGFVGLLLDKRLPVKSSR